MNTQSFKEKSNITREVAKRLRDLRRTNAIDLIVHTKKMNEKFSELNSSFAKDILNKGEVLL